MRKVFSSNVVSETMLIRDALVQQGVDATIQNEFSSLSATPEFRPPMDVWVSRDEDYERGRQIVTETIATLDSKSDAPPWVCASCGEGNPQSFETCWNCGRDKGGG